MSVAVRLALLFYHRWFQTRADMDARLVYVAVLLRALTPGYYSDVPGLVLRRIRTLYRSFMNHSRTDHCYYVLTPYH